MSRSGAFCPRCGEEIEGAAPQDADGRGLCQSCYLEEYDLVDAPDAITVLVCRECGAVQRGNRWVDVGATDYTDVAVDAVTEALGVHVDAEEVSWQVAPEQVDEATIRMHCQFTGLLRGEPVSEEVTVPVTMGRGTCDRCGRIAGGSYAGVVQVRAHRREPTAEELDAATARIESFVAAREQEGDREAFLTELTEVPGGVDAKLSTNRLGERVARDLVETFGGTYSDSETLVSEDADGNELYRVTYAVRLPAYREGEIIDPGDGEGPVLVRSARDVLRGVRLRTGEAYRAQLGEDAPEADRLGWREDAAETTLVAVEDANAIQVLDPETYEARTIARPSYVDPDAETVPVVKTRDGLFVLPDTESDDGGEGVGGDGRDGP